MEQQQQVQQGSNAHRGILNGIARLTDPRHRDERHKLIVDGRIGGNGPRQPPLDRHSLQYMVNFLDNLRDDSLVVTEMVLFHVRLVSHPSPDGGLEVLRRYFARSDTTLTKVTLRNCDFGTIEDASQLLAAFQTNRTVTDLTIQEILNLEGAALGACLANLMQNMPQLQRLKSEYCNVRMEGIRVLQPGLRNTQTLKQLVLSHCKIEDEGIHLLADALVGNTTMEVLDIGYNLITSNGLDDITHLLESTQLRKMSLRYNDCFIFNDVASTQRFARILSRHEFLEELNLSECQLGDGGIRMIVDGLVGSTIMESLDISWNVITSVGLADITRLIDSTKLKTIYLGSWGIFNDDDATQHFVSTLQHKKSSVQELLDIDEDHFPEGSGAATYANINNSLTRNQQLNRVNLLLAPPPPPQQQQQQQRNDNRTSLMMFKTWHKAIAKFAEVPNNLGASAIFKLFTARPQLLEKRLKRPTTATASVSQQQQKRRCL